MKPEGKNILLIGAAGGLGRHLSTGLLQAGARLGLAGLTLEELETLEASLPQKPQNFFTVQADITRDSDRKRCLDAMEAQFGGVDILINLAGINAFTPFEEQTPDQIEKILQVNALAPMLMTHTVLPGMLARKQGQIVNVGSTFGTIGYSCFTSYSTSKFALRGFSQALRRELAGSGIEVTYIAPRAIHTPMNTPAVYEMAKKINMHFDTPERVAGKIITAIRKGKKEQYIGFPESLFARINAILPGVVDRALRKQNPILQHYARQEAG